MIDYMITFFGDRSGEPRVLVLFHFKSSFRSQDIYIFVLTFWSCRKMA